MNPWEWNRDSIPDDIALHIASSLKVSDVCALGSCSRLWRKLCSSDYIWLSLSRNRWPSLDFSKLSSASSTVIQSSDSIHEEKFSSAQDDGFNLHSTGAPTGRHVPGRGQYAPFGERQQQFSERGQGRGFNPSIDTLLREHKEQYRPAGSPLRPSRHPYATQYPDDKYYTKTEFERQPQRHGHDTDIKALVRALTELTHDLHLKFDGKSDADAFIDWLDKVEKIVNYKRYGDLKQVAIVESRLSGYALTWWNSVQRSHKSQGYPMIIEWSKMRCDMIERLSTIDDYTDQFYLLESCACLRETKQQQVSKSAGTIMGWRSFYIRRHDEMASRAAVLIKFVESCSQSKSLEVHDYLRSIQILCSMDMVFKDIVMFLFASKQNVLLNLIGLHYSMFQLGVPVTDVIEALSDCNILEREVCVKWWKLGRWLYGFRMRDEFHSRKVFLGHLALTKEDEVFGVLHRGAIHEVLRVQIFVADVIRTPWSFKNVHQPA
ncbi:hypothetical protein GIB67_034520 [Kingdonia uniflora]|uniref:F-box domain-containing protein n=1 Tax=Kingdonia uniflora TaxID=39325 RepID=A0A7J7PBU1_9MAGN|nr:hypothetical protein GIB67_034520 [Kingdonia uniflora]